VDHISQLLIKQFNQGEAINFSIVLNFNFTSSLLAQKNGYNLVLINPRQVKQNKINAAKELAQTIISLQKLGMPLQNILQENRRSKGIC